ncbi:MAG: glutamate--tRNA ligase [Rickettsiales bacterium]|nr:glutamate--tRNA ligase [Rickettsiales bacterium]
MTTICRFAPSPTGFLHVGNIRAAIINFLYAKKTGGKFLLRLDDTDVERVKDEYRDMILTDMNWLGLKYDSLIKQSDRLDKYEAAKNLLIKSGRLYECYETPDELNIQRKSQIASGLTPIYNRAALNLTEEQKENFRAAGLKPHYRFLLEDKIVSWDDKIKGKITYEGRHFSDPVLVRDNNVPTYTFCSVVDDIEYNITDIIRGEDHITNTAIQIQIFEALIKEMGGRVPEFSHLALVKASEGKISKREGGFDVKSLRNDGYEAFSIINLLAQIGTSGQINIYKNFDELEKNFALSNFSKSSTNYDISELNHINQKLLQIVDFKDIKPRLNEIGLSEIDENFFNALKANISFLSEFKIWFEICKKEFRYNHKDADKEFLQEAAKLLPQDTKNVNCWQIWLEEIKKNTTRKGKELFMPIRLALSGVEHGPELKTLVNLIARDEIIKRLVV